MNRIVERCPSCGVEHDDRVHECEACGSAVRHWCRTHSREIGWLDAPICARCDDEEFRRTGRRPVHPPPRPVVAAVVPAAEASADPAASGAADDRMAALLRERLRAAAEEREREVAAPVPAAPAPPVAATPPAPVPAEERTAPARPGLGLRLYDAFLTVLWTAIVCVAIAGVAGGIWAWRNQELVAYFVGYWGAFGGMAGVVIGMIRAIAGFSRQSGGGRG